MKKILSILLAFIFILGLFGCTNNNDDNPPVKEDPETEDNKQEDNKEEEKEPEIEYANFFEELLAKELPLVISSDMVLPNSIDGIDIAYECDYSFIDNNIKSFTRWIYPFDKEDKVLNLKCKYEFEWQEWTSNFEISVLGTNNINKIDRFDINTNNVPILDKENYVSGFASLSSYNNGAYEMSEDILPMKIKLRGNSTMLMPKKPYKIKFDEKVSFYGIKAQKTWVLLANHCDQSLLRNYLAFTLGNKMENFAWTPKVNYVDVYLNGEYQGNYILTEQIEVKSGRVDIDNTSNINTGYLVELDQHAFETGEANIGVNAFTIGGIPYVIKSPDSDGTLTPEMVSYIGDYMNTAYNALRNKKNYLDYIDIDSFVDWCIVNEVMKNCDCGYSSVYFTKDKDGKLFAGPIWDFDLSSGNMGHDSDYGRSIYGFRCQERNTWYSLLFEIPEFKQALKNRWNEKYTEIIGLLDTIKDLSPSIRLSFYENFQMWDIIGKEVDWWTAPETLQATTYDAQLNYLYDFLEKRIAWLDVNIKGL